MQACLYVAPVYRFQVLDGVLYSESTCTAWQSSTQRQMICIVHNHIWELRLQRV